MEKHLDNEDGIRALLSLSTVDPLLVDTLCNLRESGMDSWEYIAGKCHEHDDIDSISRVIVAVTASLPTKAEDWLDMLVSPIRLLLDFPEHHPELKITTEYVLGLTHGIFTASNWYDAQFHRGSFKSESPLVEKFDFLIKYFLTKNPVTDGANGRLLANEKFAEKYESQLSGLIKTFVRCGKSPGARMASAVNLIEHAHKKIKADDPSNDNVSKLGSIIFDQIAYAIFGSMSTSGRARTIVAFNEEILKF